MGWGYDAIHLSVTLEEAGNAQGAVPVSVCIGVMCHPCEFLGKTFMFALLSAMCGNPGESSRVRRVTMRSPDGLTPPQVRRPRRRPPLAHLLRLVGLGSAGPSPQLQTFTVLPSTPQSSLRVYWSVPSLP